MPEDHELPFSFDRAVSVGTNLELYYVVSADRPIAVGDKVEFALDWDDEIHNFKAGAVEGQAPSILTIPLQQELSMGHLSLYS